MTVTLTETVTQWRAGLNDGLFSETMDFHDFPSVLSAVRIAQSWYLALSLPISYKDPCPKISVHKSEIKVP